MKTKDLITIATTALGTTTLTATLFWPGPLEAGLEAESLAAKIAKPKLVVQGVEMTFAAADGCDLKAGVEPRFELSAVNTTCGPATVTVRLAMTTSSPADALSRLPRRPSVLWQQHQCLTLKPNETKTVTILTQRKLPPNTMVALSLAESDPLQPQEATGGLDPLPKLQSAVSSRPEVVAMTFSTGSLLGPAVSAN
jgi:hypothetical protein